MTRSILFLSLLAALLAPAQTPETPRRLEVLFLGDDRGHKPIERYQVLKQVLGPQGFNLTFVEDLAKITRRNLDLYDALIVYANHEKDQVPPDIIPWVRDGGALVALHSACGNFHPSKAWFDLVGGRFKSHEGHEFSPKTVDPDHPVTKDLPVLKSWDETYQHQNLTTDRHLLQVREPLNKDESEPEPWTWTRNEGKGRVFYTASGHDLRCWNEEPYQVLVRRAILWAMGEKRAEAFSRFKLPQLDVEVPEVAHRTHPEIPMMPLQKPLSPADSAAHTQVPVATKLQLFASEPMVVNPIAIDWDERGRAWVVESFGYPNNVPDEPGTGEDKIKILEDTDGDGRADTMTVFAERLRHCTTSVFVKGGVVVTDGRDIVYLADGNGDGKADIRKVLATGLIMHDTHASVSQFLYGIDNWIYATVGYSGVDMNIAGEKHKFAQAVFRFLPDLSRLELLQNSTNNTWGLGFTEQGDVIGSTANNNPSWMLSIPASAYAGSGIEQPKTPRIDTSSQIYPNTRDVTQVDQIGSFTAAAGHQFHTDDVLADTFSPANAFICEPTGHLVATADVLDNGSLKKTLLRGNNAFASSDAWASPVAARVGPDGALWIADWYNPIIQHNVVFRYHNPARGYDQAHSPYQSGEKKGPGKGNAYETPLRDRTHGRIWRVVPATAPVRAVTGLDPASPETLVAGLSSPSQLIRLHAQRLLVERGGSDLIKPLEMLVSAGDSRPLAALHAVWTLRGIGASPGSDAYRILTEALDNPDARIRRHAMLALGADDLAVIDALPEMITKTTDPRELLFLLTAVSQTPPNPKIADALWRLVSGGMKPDDTLLEAARLAMRRQSLSLLSACAADFSAAPPATWFDKEIPVIIARIAASPNRPALVALAATAPPVLRGHLESALAATPDTTPTPAALPDHLTAGRDSYLKTCIECHQANGEGVPDTFPPLAGSERVKGDADTLLRIMLGGLAGPIEIQGGRFNGVMPGHSHLKDEEIAAIASFVRHSFGGIEGMAITPERVKSLRPEVEKRNFKPWSAEELRKPAAD